MNKIVAVEDNLASVKDFLSAKGCQIIDVEKARNRQVDAVVISGMDENLLGMEDVTINAPVINAKGRTPEEVWNNISRQ